MSFVVPTFVSLLNTGQTFIPVGTRSFTINVISGSVNLGTTGTVLVAPAVISMNMPDSKLVLGQGFAVTCSGAGNKAIVFWAQ